jgi:hypothetical protein
MYSGRDTLSGTKTDAGQVSTMSDAIGRAARRVTDALVAQGFGVQTREWAELWNLTIVGAEQARSCLTAADDGYLRWDYQPHTGPATSPTALAATVLYLFGASAQDLPPDEKAYPTFLLKGATGRVLQDRGLKVELLTYQDLESFDVIADISVTSPDRPALGSVRVNDHADIEWECRADEAFGGDPAGIVAVVAPILRHPLPARPPRPDPPSH